MRGNRRKLRIRAATRDEKEPATPDQTCRTKENVALGTTTVSVLTRSDGRDTDCTARKLFSDEEVDDAEVESLSSAQVVSPAVHTGIRINRVPAHLCTGHNRAWSLWSGDEIIGTQNHFTVNFANSDTTTKLWDLSTKVGTSVSLPQTWTRTL